MDRGCNRSQSRIYQQSKRTRCRSLSWIVYNEPAAFHTQNRTLCHSSPYPPVKVHIASDFSSFLRVHGSQMLVASDFSSFLRVHGSQMLAASDFSSFLRVHGSQMLAASDFSSFLRVHGSQMLAAFCMFCMDDTADCLYPQ